MSPGPATRMFRHLLALGAGNYGAMAISLAINAVLTRRLGVDAFGRLALLLMASQVTSLLVANWTHSGLVKFGAQEYAVSGSVATSFWTRIWIAAPWTLVAAALVVIARQPLAAYLGIAPWELSIVAAHFAATFVLTSLGAVFQARGEMPRYGATLFLDKALMIAMVGLLPAAWVQRPAVVLGLYAASSLGVATLSLLLVGRAALGPVRIDRSAYRAMLGFSLPLILSSWAGLLGTNWFDFVVIKAYRPVSDVGIYSLGTVLAGVVQQVTIIFSTLLLPQLSVMVARGEETRIRRLIERVLPYWFLATSGLFCVVILNVGWVVPLVFGSSFERSVAIVVLLMPATCALALFNAFSPLLSAMGATWALSGICLASGAVNVGMDLLLVPTYGVYGAAIATIVAYATSAILVLAFVNTRLRIPVLALAWLALPVVVVCLCFIFLSGLLFYAVAIPAGLVTAGLLARRFRLFRSEDAAFLQELRLAARLTSGAPFAAVKRG